MSENPRPSRAFSAKVRGAGEAYATTVLGFATMGVLAADAGVTFARKGVEAVSSRLPVTVYKKGNK
jgi:hypothetical protein